MSQTYTIAGQLQPINPTQPAAIARLCERCGALVNDMSRHDRHHDGLIELAHAVRLLAKA